MTGAIHIVGDDGEELPVGEEGEVWFETTRDVRVPQGPGEDRRRVERPGLGVARRRRPGRRRRLPLPDRPGVEHDHQRAASTSTPARSRTCSSCTPPSTDVARARHARPGDGRAGHARSCSSRTPTDRHRRDVRRAAPVLPRPPDPLQVPPRWSFVDELPRLPTGKLAKRMFSDEVRGLAPLTSPDVVHRSHRDVTPAVPPTRCAGWARSPMTSASSTRPSPPSVPARWGSAAATTCSSTVPLPTCPPASSGSSPPRTSRPATFMMASGYPNEVSFYRDFVVNR